MGNTGVGNTGDERRPVSRARALVAMGVLLPALVAGSSAGQSAADEGTPAIASPSTGDASADIEVLKRRAAGFWVARVNKDLQAQYGFIEPRVKARASADQWVRGQGPGAMEYLAYQVEEARVDGSYATVTVRLLVRPNLPALTNQRIGPQAVRVHEQWVRIAGAWYRVEPQPSAGSRASGG